VRHVVLHLVKVIVQPSMASNDMDCGSLVSSVCYESGVEVTDDLGLFVAKNLLGVFGSTAFSFLLIKLGILVVNLFPDIGVWYGAVEDGVT
jgi:hypothetical protein